MTLSPFIRRMRQLLAEREAATCEDDKQAAEREMTDLIRSLNAPKDPRDYKAAQSGERTD